MLKIVDIVDGIREIKGCKLIEFVKIYFFRLFFIIGCFLVVLVIFKVLEFVVF